MLRKERAQEGNSPCNSQVKQEGTRKDFVNQGDLHPFSEFIFSIERCPRQESNLCTCLRRAVLYPLSYGGAGRRVGYMTMSTSEKAFFATGCFWGAERRFWNLDGVIATSVGYMGGARPNPSYEQVCTGVTGHAETVEVDFDPAKVSYRRLLEEFWVMHDPTSLNRQGGDIGTQYRSAIFTTTAAQQLQAEVTRDVYQAALTRDGIGPIVTEIASAEGVPYFLAEEYHQKYLKKNPNGYDCHSSTGVNFPQLSNS